MIDWDIAYDLNTPQGTFQFNQATTSPFTSDGNYLYLLDHEKCSATPGPLRLTIDPIPQADGSIIPPSFKSGYQLRLSVQLWVQDGDGADARSPACCADKQVMWDTLLMHMNALMNPSVADLYGGNARLLWTPCDYVDGRLLDHIRLTEWPTVADEGNVSVVTLTLGTEFPYSIDAVENQNYLDWVAFNGGSSVMYPVFRVFATGAPVGSFTITNMTTGESISYDEGYPGANFIPAGQFVEINTFRNTVYLNGSGANYKPGINVAASDFFPLQLGENDITFTSDIGGSCLMLWQNAWA